VELADHERSTVWLPGGGGGVVVEPLPVRPTVPAADELIMAVRVPLAGPAADGVKVMVPFTLWPAFNVNGSVTPLTENTGAFMESWLTVRLDPPVLDMEIVSALLLPTLTLPKSRLDEEN